MFLLRVVPAIGDPFDVTVGEEPLIVGRASDSAVVIGDRFLSRHHARLFTRGGELFVEDLGSRNGTLLNENPISRPTAVKTGDVIKLSASRITVSRGKPQSAELTTEERELGEMTVFKPASDLIDTGVTSDITRIGSEPELRRLAGRLRLINEVHRALSWPIDLDQVLDLILDRAFEHLRPEEGLVFLKQPDDSLELAARRSLQDGQSDYLYSRTLIREVSDKGLAAVVLDTRTDQRFSESDSIMTSGVRSLVAAPLLDTEGSLGMIVLSSRLHVRQFSEDDMELLASLASAAALRIRNIRLAGEAEQRRRLQHELSLARRIQTALLPSRLPELPGYDLHGGNAPSLQVSGDYYEVRLRNEDRECVLMLADVSGKGVAASLLTAALVAMSAGPIEDGDPPDEICFRVSRLLHDRTPPERYATAVLAVLEPASGRIRYVNAGHNPGLVVRAGGEIEQLGSTGPPLGCLRESRFELAATRLDPGDLLILYTDGITETINGRDEEFGLERLIEVGSRHRTSSAAGLAKALEQSLDRFAGGVPAPDDRTIVVARRLPAA